MDGLKNEKYIVSDLPGPETLRGRASVFPDYAKRILWLDSEMLPGAFQMTCMWYLKPSTRDTAAHSHDSAEIIGFFGSDSQNANDLGGEIEMWLEDEKYLLSKSCLIFVPAGMKHCPLTIRRVDRPIFHFTTVNQGLYKQIKE